jgi:hypothetical protein
VTERQLREVRGRDLVTEAAEGVHLSRRGPTPGQARCSACRPGRRKRR